MTGGGNTTRASTIRHRTALFDGAAAIIEREYRDPPGLDDVARRIATSRRQLQRAFAEIGGTTFREHVTAVRMRKAAELLAGSPQPTVQSVADHVGYRQSGQFAKAFRRHIGVAPVEYRTRAGGAGAAPEPRFVGRLPAAA